MSCTIDGDEDIGILVLLLLLMMGIMGMMGGVIFFGGDIQYCFRFALFGS